MAAGEFTHNDVELVQRDTLFQGFYRVDKLRLRHRHFDGSMGPEISRELFVRPSAVGVVVYDAARDEVLLIEQFRVGAYGSKHPWQYEVVAGLVGPNESLEDVAKRETLEEAGVTITTLEKVFGFFQVQAARMSTTPCLLPLLICRALAAFMGWRKKVKTFA